MVNTQINGMPTYQFIASEVKRTTADGCVVGLTGFVEEEYIKNIQNKVGDNKIFLMQGIGPQGGGESDMEKIKLVPHPLVSLGREVIFSENVRDSVKKYHDIMKKVNRS